MHGELAHGDSANAGLARLSTAKTARRCRDRMPFVLLMRSDNKPKMAEATDNGNRIESL